MGEYPESNCHWPSLLRWPSGSVNKLPRTGVGPNNGSATRGSPLTAASSSAACLINFRRNTVARDDLNCRILHARLVAFINLPLQHSTRNTTSKICPLETHLGLSSDPKSMPSISFIIRPAKSISFPKLIVFTSTFWLVKGNFFIFSLLSKLVASMIEKHRDLGFALCYAVSRCLEVLNIRFSVSFNRSYTFHCASRTARIWIMLYIFTGIIPKFSNHYKRHYFFLSSSYMIFPAILAQVVLYFTCLILRTNT